ncbi:hypothetical protein KW807_00730 [Candidatus Parcubacteria bacterium]|nr:hypothetical protein [Candidatus Parcubacteria bacterium]
MPSKEGKMFERNGKLIRNLIGNRADYRVVRIIEEVYERGPAHFAEVAPRLFLLSKSTPVRMADVSVWMVRVFPDDAHIWMEALMAEFWRVTYQNDDYTHVMLVTILETTAAFYSLSKDSSEVGKEFDKSLPKWLASVLLRGRNIPVRLEQERSITKAVQAFARYHLVSFVVCDTMRIFIEENAKERILWDKPGITDFAIRQLAVLLVGSIYEIHQVIETLSKYRELKRFL